MTSTRPDPRGRVQLTLLSSILGADFPLALERQKSIGIRYLDLKDGIWGKTVETLTGEEAARAAALIDGLDLRVHCLSTSIGYSDPESDTDEAAFRARHEPALGNVLRVARVLRPEVVRLLAPRLAPSAGECAVKRLDREFPWFVSVYRDWIDRIGEAGCGVLIENEASGCVLATITDITLFLARLNHPDARFTWDVQNLWQRGTFPSLETYRRIAPWVGEIHLKGGRHDGSSNSLVWASSLEEASWTVVEIVRAVLEDGLVSYLCLNPSHGMRPSDWDTWEVAQRDVAFLRREFEAIA
jgi:sugar phosphate isomerase/epimerase